MRFVCLICLILLAGCKKSNHQPTVFNDVKGTLTGPEACSLWVIKLADNTPLEPVNLDSFQITLKSGQPVIFSYELNSLSHVCLSGQPIELLSIRDDQP